MKKPNISYKTMQKYCHPGDIVCVGWRFYEVGFNGMVAALFDSYNGTFLKRETFKAQRRVVVECIISSSYDDSINRSRMHDSAVSDIVNDILLERENYFDNRLGLQIKTYGIEYRLIHSSYFSGVHYNTFEIKYLNRIFIDLITTNKHYDFKPPKNSLGTSLTFASACKELFNSIMGIENAS